LSRLQLLPKVWRVVTDWGADAAAARDEQSRRSSLDGYTLAGGVQLEDSVYEDIDEIEASPDVSPGKHSSLTDGANKAFKAHLIPSEACVHHAARMRASDEEGDAEPTADAVNVRDVSPGRLLSPETSARLGSPESSKRSVGKKKGAAGKRRIRKKTHSVVPRDMEATGTVLDSKGLRLFHLMRMFALNYTITGDMLLSLIQLLGRGGGFPSEEVRFTCRVRSC
jgi:hypothetical protein